MMRDLHRRCVAVWGFSDIAPACGFGVDLGRLGLVLGVLACWRL